MSFLVLCPRCRHQVAVQETQGGQLARCPYCKTPFQVPARPAPKPSPPPPQVRKPAVSRPADASILARGGARPKPLPSRPTHVAPPRKNTALAPAPSLSEPPRQSRTLFLGCLSFGLVAGLLAVVLGGGFFLFRDQLTATPQTNKKETRLADASAAKQILPVGETASQSQKAKETTQKSQASKSQTPSTTGGGLEEGPNEPPPPVQPPRDPPVRRPMPKVEEPAPEPMPKPDSLPKTVASKPDGKSETESPKETTPPRSKSLEKETEPKVETAKKDEPAKKESETTQTTPKVETAKSDTPASAEEPRRLSGDQIYRRLVKASVFVFTGESWGSGSLVHREKRLILTNYHVVGENSTVSVSFPRYERSGKLIVDGEYYMRAHKNGEFIRGKVVKVAKGKDLALVELERVPEGTPVLKLSARGVRPGQAVHSVGNPGASDARWAYTSGTVRQLSHKNWKAKLGQTVLTFDADVIETQSPTNPGDSGGPLVNDSLELVGVTQGYNAKAREVSMFIDITEVKKLLEDLGVPLTEVVSSAETADAGALEGADIATLIKHLQNPDASLRAEAARHLGEMGSDARSAARALKKALTDEDAGVRRNAALALGQLGPDARGLVRRDVFAALRDRESDVRTAALQALANLGPPDEDELALLLSLLRQAARRREVKSALAISRSLALVGPEAKDAVADLRTLLLIDNRDLRAAVLAVLQKLGPDAHEAAPDMVALLKESERALRLQTAFALAAVDPRMGREGREALSVLVLTLRPESAAEMKDPQHTERVKTIKAQLIKVGEPAAERLMRGIQEDFRTGLRKTETATLNAEARKIAVQIIAAIGKDAYSPGLSASLAELSRNDPSQEVRVAAREAFIIVQKK